MGESLLLKNVIIIAPNQELDIEKRDILINESGQIEKIAANLWLAFRLSVAMSSEPV